jgi:hypothetical protein
MAVVTVCRIAQLRDLPLNPLIAMAKASEVLHSSDPDAQVKEVKAWLKSKGVRDFEPVSLFCDQLAKVCDCPGGAFNLTPT